MMLCNIQLVHVLLARRVILCSPMLNDRTNIVIVFHVPFLFYVTFRILHTISRLYSCYVFSAFGLSVTNINSMGLTRLGRNSVLLTDSAKAEDTFIYYYYYTSTKTSVSVATTTTSNLLL